MKIIRKKLSSVRSDIKRRCYNKDRKDYAYYGGIGISMCEEWYRSLDCFIDWSLSNGYKDGLSIDRINTNGNYDPLNCRWTTKTVQSRNTRKRKDNTTGYRGVSYRKDNKKFRATIAINGKTISLGQSDSALECAIMYNMFVINNKLEHTLNYLPDSIEDNQVQSTSKPATKSKGSW